jgi:hypothetical protein
MNWDYVRGKKKQKENKKKQTKRKQTKNKYKKKYKKILYDSLVLYLKKKKKFVIYLLFSYQTGSRRPYQIPYYSRGIEGEKRTHTRFADCFSYNIKLMAFINMMKVRNQPKLRRVVTEAKRNKNDIGESQGVFFKSSAGLELKNNPS